MIITLSTLLGVTKGRLMGDMDDLFDFYNFYVGMPVFTQQLPRIYEQTREAITAQHPFLNSIDLSDITKENYKVILGNLIAEHGDSFDVARPLCFAM